MKDCNETNAIKIAKLEEKLKGMEESETKERNVPNHNSSFITYQIPSGSGYGRSQSPRVGNSISIKMLEHEHKIIVDKLNSEINGKNSYINELLSQIEQDQMKISELQNNNDYLTK